MIKYLLRDAKLRFTLKDRSTLNSDILNIISGWLTANPRRRLATVQRAFNDVIELWTSEDDMFLSTSFSRLAFFIQKYDLTGRAKTGLYRLRAEMQRFESGGDSYPHSKELLHLAELVFDWLKRFHETGKQPFFPVEDIPTTFKTAKSERSAFIRSKRLLLVGPADGEGVFFGVDDHQPETEIQVHLPVIEVFTGENLSSYFGSILTFPLFVNLFDITVEEDKYLPNYYIVLPDYLVDVTAIAAGFQSAGFSVWPSYVRRVLPVQTTYHMLLGNIVNHALDRIIVNRALSLKDLFSDIFNLFPLDILRMSDQDVRKLMLAVKTHTATLKKVVANDFDKLDIRPSRCELEPTFLSSEYGLQGRLDVLHRNDETTIIELKSGKPYKPNSYGIKKDHYVQTLLYDLLIRSAGISKSPRNFILYSGQNEKALRYAPPVKAIQVEALKGRNELVLLDAMMRHSNIDFVEAAFQHFDKKAPDELGSFTARDIEIIRSVFKSSSRVAWQYYIHFFAFVMRELAIAKVGIHGQESTAGLASVWLKAEEEKLKEFSLLSHLELSKYYVENGNVFLEMSFSEKTDPLANFRKGDVVVLYPYKKGQKSALQNQIHKSSIVDKSQDSITIRLRSKQYDEEFFSNNQYWCVERDVLDSSFNSSFDSLFLFLNAPKETRELLLGQRKPGVLNKVLPSFEFSDHLLAEQKRIIEKIYQSEDYFLLWGPPGTGKTSVMIRELIRLFHETTDQDIYLLAYTNKAVDELCSAVMSLGEDIRDASVRIGSSHSCAKIYHKLLFDRQIQDIGDRRGLVEFLRSKRVFISTLASFWGRRRMIKRPGRDILIVDEASQILEPSIIGLLPLFEKTILVGDHLQLPAVSVQRDETAVVSKEELLELGFSDLKTSMFERLFRQQDQKGWNDHHAILKHQGRMHSDIMSFVNREFYADGLACVPGLARLTTEEPPIAALHHRMIYIPSIAFPDDPMVKNNLDEAQKVVNFVNFWLKQSGLDIEDLEPEICGIITPFRAQIALIKYMMNEQFGTAANRISVDTVERYQGSARDLIIISLCLNRKSQLRNVVSTSKSGVDRKFNVALTRARNQVVVIGNEEIMELAPSYKAFISASQMWSPEQESVTGNEK